VKLDVYLNFRGNCEEAFRFYEQELGAKPIFLHRHGDNPNPNIPPDWKDKVLHAQIQLAGVGVMGADIPGAEPMRSAYLSVTVDTPAEADRLYARLSDGGEIFMKMETTFFANRFAMLRDRFGISWMLLQGMTGA
jgi:PhnB protein